MGNRREMKDLEAQRGGRKQEQDEVITVNSAQKK